jgi:hypothetical protein
MGGWASLDPASDPRDLDNHRTVAALVARGLATIDAEGREARASP